MAGGCNWNKYWFRRILFGCYCYGCRFDIDLF
jgi:hypothetical protein